MLYNIENYYPHTACLLHILRISRTLNSFSGVNRNRLQIILWTSFDQMPSVLILEFRVSDERPPSSNFPLQPFTTFHSTISHPFATSRNKTPAQCHNQHGSGILPDNYTLLLVQKKQSFNFGTANLVGKDLENGVQASFYLLFSVFRHLSITHFFYHNIWGDRITHVWHA